MNPIPIPAQTERPPMRPKPKPHHPDHTILRWLLAAALLLSSCPPRPKVAAGPGLNGNYLGMAGTAVSHPRHQAVPRPDIEIKTVHTAKLP